MFSLTCSVASLSQCLKHYPPGHYILQCNALVAYLLGLGEPSTCMSLAYTSCFTFQVPKMTGNAQLQVMLQALTAHGLLAWIWQNTQASKKKK